MNVETPLTAHLTSLGSMHRKSQCGLMRGRILILCCVYLHTYVVFGYCECDRFAAVLVCHLWNEANNWHAINLLNRQHCTYIDHTRCELHVRIRMWWLVWLPIPNVPSTPHNAVYCIHAYWCSLLSVHTYICMCVCLSFRLSVSVCVRVYMNVCL